MDSPDWKTSLSASDRYNTILSIQSSRGLSMPEAIPIEQEACRSATSHQEYLGITQAKGPSSQTTQEPPSGANDDNDEHEGINIGSYANCHFIAEGITSQVYRSGSTALKVIVSHAEPHNPQREVRILQALRDSAAPAVIELLDVFRDHEQQLVLVFPRMPLTLADAISSSAVSPLPRSNIQSLTTDVLRALSHLHAQGIVHRDVKPSAVLLASPTGPAYLSDFGTAWHPDFSATAEPASSKILDIGTGPYRAPEVLFGHASYGPPVDMWGLGVMLSEMVRTPPRPLFESRPAHEDGSQLGLILSIFKTLGTPTPETWPEAKAFKVTPFELWTVFPPKRWDELLPDVNADVRDLIASLLRFDGKRATADDALKSSFISQ